MILEGLIGAAEEYSYQMDLDAQIENDIRQAVGKLENATFERSELDKVGKTYGAKAKSPDDIGYEMSNYVHSLLYFMNNVGIDEVANGSIKESSALYQDSLKNILEIVSLEHILNSQMLDSLRVYGEEKVLKYILEDIMDDKRIAYLLNTNPRTLRIYINSMNSHLRKNPAHLSYWATDNDFEHAVDFPNNTFIIDPFKLSFRGKDIYSGDKLIASIDNHGLQVYDINLLNLIPMPNSIYHYDNITYHTDAIGRVVRVEQTISLEGRGKCKQRAKLKAKHFATQQIAKEQLKAYHLGLIKYRAPECYVNTIFVTNSQENKKAIKTVNKEVRKNNNSNKKTKVITVIDYEKGSRLSRMVTININGRDVATIK